MVAEVLEGQRIFPPVEVFKRHHIGNWRNLRPDVDDLLRKPTNSTMFSTQAENIFRGKRTFTLWPTLAIPTSVYRPPEFRDFLLVKCKFLF